LKKELDMGKGRKEEDVGRGQAGGLAVLTASPHSLDLLVVRALVAVRAELLQLQPFGGVAAVLLGGVTGHPRRALGGIGPAFGALESDHDPDALVFGHRKDVRRWMRGEMTIRHFTLPASAIPILRI
jgi:hypothetical protein